MFYPILILGGMLMFNLTAILESFVLLSLVLTGPILFFAYMIYISKSGDTSFSFAEKKQRIIFSVVMVSIAVSLSAIILYTVNNPSVLGFGI